MGLFGARWGLSLRAHQRGAALTAGSSSGGTIGVKGATLSASDLHMNSHSVATIGFQTFGLRMPGSEDLVAKAQLDNVDRERDQILESSSRCV